jgi:hypothetical protein
MPASTSQPCYNNLPPNRATVNVWSTQGNVKPYRKPAECYCLPDNKKARPTASGRTGYMCSIIEMTLRDLTCANIWPGESATSANTSLPGLTGKGVCPSREPPAARSNDAESENEKKHARAARSSAHVRAL